MINSYNLAVGIIALIAFSFIFAAGSAQGQCEKTHSATVCFHELN